MLGAPAGRIERPAQQNQPIHAVGEPNLLLCVLAVGWE
jgi:hypothetical protein